MANRADLQAFLEDLLESPNVYFNPPESMKLDYPAIVYNLSNVIFFRANDSKYITKSGYQLTLMDHDPDSKYADKLLNVQYCSFDRAHKANGLHHWVFTLYD